MSESQIIRSARLYRAAIRKLNNIERHGSRRAKVFAKRARKMGWTVESIVAALSYGVNNFGAPIEF